MIVIVKALWLLKGTTQIVEKLFNVLNNNKFCAPRESGFPTLYAAETTLVLKQLQLHCNTMRVKWNQ